MANRLFHMNSELVTLVISIITFISVLFVWKIDFFNNQNLAMYSLFVIKYGR